VLALTAPSGTIATAYPTFAWNAGQEATFYFLQINKGTAVYVQKWFTAAEVESDGNCEAPSPKGLGPGSYRAWVRGWNPNGYGAWSAAVSFTVSPFAVPGQATLSGPEANVNVFFPTLTWAAVEGADQYQVQIMRGTTKLLDKWYTKEALCSDGTCTLVSPAGHATGSYRAWVRTWNPAGLGPWSAARNYTVTAPTIPDKPF